MAIQYTIRNIPPSVDKALKKRAQITRKSFNQTVVDELSKLVEPASQKEDFSWLANTITEEDAKIFDETLADLNKPDPKFWQ